MSSFSSFREFNFSFYMKDKKAWCNLFPKLNARQIITSNVRRANFHKFLIIGIFSLFCNDFCFCVKRISAWPQWVFKPTHRCLFSVLSNKMKISWFMYAAYDFEWFLNFSNVSVRFWKKNKGRMKRQMNWKRTYLSPWWENFAQFDSM